MSRLGAIKDAAERLTGVSVQPVTEVHRLQEAEQELRGKQRELSDLAYTILDYVQGAPQEMRAQERRRLCQRARVVWQQDPQYGGTINLLNEFVLGRGIPKPQAVDDEVQDVIDTFWEDPDNERILTTHGAQVRFNTDLSLQSNVFPLVYDDGDDGLVKLGLLDHDTVEQAVRDPDARLRILYYFTKSYTREWDPEKHTYKVSRERERLRYYEDFRNLKDAQADAEAGVRKEDLPQIDTKLVGRGRVMQVAINRTTEQAFGVPEIARTIRWLTAYNDLMRARVDMAKAAASIIMRRKLKGGAAAMQQLASQALMQSGATPLAPVDPMTLGQAPKPGSLVEENDWVQHEAFNLNSGSQGAMQDAQMIRSQYSVGTGWPQSYLGDPSATNLSTATTLELRVLKMVEARQQVLEDLIRKLVDHAIQRAIEQGKLTKYRPMTPEEVKREHDERRQDEAAEQAPGAPAIAQAAANGNGNGLASARNGKVKVDAVRDERPDEEEAPRGHVERDLSFQVAMPSPLRRAMGDLINAVSIVAKTFDPNASNMELSKTLLGIAFGEGFEMEDPGAAVERIFPPGYVDPMVLAAQAQAGAAGGLPQMPQPGFTPENEGGFGPPGPGFGSTGADGQFHPNPSNPYGAAQRSLPPGQAMQQAAEELSDVRLVQLHQRGGEMMPHHVQEAVARRAVARVAPTAVGIAAAARLGEARGEEAELLSDTLLGPALARSLALLAGRGR